MTQIQRCETCGRGLYLSRADKCSGCGSPLIQHLLADMALREVVAARDAFVARFQQPATAKHGFWRNFLEGAANAAVSMAPRRW
jgi:hypothetical protein